MLALERIIDQECTPSMTTAIDRLLTAQADAMQRRPQVGGFPTFAAILHRAGVRRNEWTLPAAQSVYVTDAGPVVQLGTPVSSGTDSVPPFDERAVIRAVRTDQAGNSTFLEFLAACWQAGVVRYVVDFDARVVTYVGVNGESYVEAYPEVSVD